MSIKVGGIDLTEGVLDSQFRIAVLEKIVEQLLKRSGGALTQQDVERFRREALTELQRKYPEAGIELKK